MGGLQHGHDGPAMQQAQMLAGDYSVMLQRQLRQYAHAFFAQLAIIELVVARKSTRGNAFVPVAAQDQAAMRHGPIKGIRRAWTLAHDIAQTPDFIDGAGFQILLQRFHGGQVAVQIGNQGDALHREASRISQSKGARCSG